MTWLLVLNIIVWMARLLMLMFRMGGGLVSMNACVGCFSFECLGPPVCI